MQPKKKEIPALEPQPAKKPDPAPLRPQAADRLQGRRRRGAHRDHDLLGVRGLPALDRRGGAPGELAELTHRARQRERDARREPALRPLPRHLRAEPGRALRGVIAPVTAEGIRKTIG